VFDFAWDLVGICFFISSAHKLFLDEKILLFGDICCILLDFVFFALVSHIGFVLSMLVFFLVSEHSIAPTPSFLFIFWFYSTLASNFSFRLFFPCILSFTWVFDFAWDLVGSAYDYVLDK